MKKFDILLIGATGFTGKRAARYLSEHANNLNFAIAARNSTKLKEISSSLNIADENCFIVDTLDQNSLDSAISQANIVITTVGPFSLYGELVIASCVKYGSHYLDITGEVDFIRKMMDKYNSDAIQNKSILIPFSGFDSVPADITAYLLCKEFSADDKIRIKSYYKISGGFNGGTIATMLNKFDSGEYKKMGNPTLLMNIKNQKIGSSKGTNYFGYDKNISRWTAPFIMGAINSKIVYKSADDFYLKENKRYANELVYSEHSSLSKWYNPFPFLFISVFLFSFSMLAPFKWFRKIIKFFAPEPGEGPSEKVIESGYFSLLAIAKNGKGKISKLKISYAGDPGNKATVFFLCESALHLHQYLKDKEKKSHAYGFQTPMHIFEDSLVIRLKKGGLKIESV